jgi:hypothetical protein
MRNMVIPLSILFQLCMMQASGQSSVEVPTVILRQFHAEFASVSKASWKVEKDSTYRVVFSLAQDRRPYMARYDQRGRWLEKKIGVNFSQLPMSVIEELVRRFENFKPVESLRFETPGNKPVYQVALVKWKPGEKFRETYSLELSPEGELLKEPEMQLARVVSEGKSPD